MTVGFQIEGQDFVAINGGPAPADMPGMMTFNLAVSFVVNCETQEEVDYYWDRLKEGGDEKAQICGWLKDKYGVSWQIVPTVLGKMLSDPDQEKSRRVMAAMLQMKKIIIADLEKAYQ